MSPNTTPRGGLVAAALLCVPLAAVQAQDRFVTSAADDGPGSFREAVAMSTQDGRAIRFADAIGDVDLASPLTISGAMRFAGAADGSTVIQGAGLRFAASPGDTVYLTGVTFRDNRNVSGGALSIPSGAAVVAKDVTFVGNEATGDDASEGGGAVYNAGYFYAEDVAFDFNRATGDSGSGGAIFNADGGTLQIVSSTFTENFASRAGGAVEDASGSGTDVTFFETDFTGNYTRSNPGNGGAIHVTGDGDVDVFGGMATDNSAAAEGGAFWNGAGTMHLDGVTIRDNTASGNDADQGGGGVYNSGGRVIVVNETTFDANAAVGFSGSGGGLLNGPGGVLEVYGATFTDNTAVRAGGAIEDNSGDGLGLRLFNVVAAGNRTGGNPGNGGAVHITGPGDSEVKGGTYADNYAAAEGGALWNGSGTMIVRDVQITGNEAAGPTPTNGGGGIFNNGGTLDIGAETLLADNFTSDDNGSGGAIFNATDGKLTINNSTLRDNVSTGVGGAIEDASGASTVTEIYDCVMSGNRTLDLPGCGGAVHFKGMSNARVYRTDVTGNRGTEGGGLWNGAGELEVRDCNVLDNVAFGEAAVHQGGGGLYNGAGLLTVVNTTVANNRSEGSDAIGGGIKQDTKGKTVVRFSTIVDNVSAFNGGGIGVDHMAEVYSSTVAGNTAANSGGAIALTVGGYDVPTRNSIFVENEAGDEGDNFFTVTGAVVVSLGNNLLDEADPDFYRAAPSDIFLGDGEDAGLGELADNGGRTLTLALECGSPAIDAADDVFGPDQAGNAGFGESRDIGAVERQEACDDDDIEFAAAATLPALHVYPTHVRNGRVTVDLGADTGLEAGTQTVLSLVDLQGRTVREVVTTRQRTSVETDGLRGGTYFVQSRSPEGVRSGRVTVVE